jgi:hypothetical protein
VRTLRLYRRPSTPFSACSGSYINAPASCYWPNKNSWWNVLEYEYYRPCHNVDSLQRHGHKACAALPGWDGLLGVMRTGVWKMNYVTAAAVLGENCADPTWQDPACIRLFVNGSSMLGSLPSQDREHHRLMMIYWRTTARTFH